jgi:hypothetical protein
LRALPHERGPALAPGMVLATTVSAPVQCADIFGKSFRKVGICVDARYLLGNTPCARKMARFNSTKSFRKPGLHGYLRYLLRNTRPNALSPLENAEYMVARGLIRVSPLDNCTYTAPRGAPATRILA